MTQDEYDRLALVQQRLLTAIRGAPRASQRVASLVLKAIKAGEVFGCATRPDDIVTRYVVAALAAAVRDPEVFDALAQQRMVEMANESEGQR